MAEVAGCLLPAQATEGHPAPPKGDRFLKGPVPLDWLLRAGALPGDTLKAGVLVWHVAGLARSWTGLALPPRVWQNWYRDRSTFSRALARLEAAGLIVVDRQRGRSPIVGIITKTEGNHEH
jgi:hypothetical protein